MTHSRTTMVYCWGYPINQLFLNFKDHAAFLKDQSGIIRDHTLASACRRHNWVSVSPSRGSVCSVLLTCCKDSVCRLWAETLLPDDSLLSSHHNNHTTAQQSDPLRPSGPCGKNGSGERSQGKVPLQVSLIVAYCTLYCDDYFDRNETEPSSVKCTSGS